MSEKGFYFGESGTEGASESATESGSQLASPFSMTSTLDNSSSVSSPSTPNPNIASASSASSTRRIQPGIWNVCHIPDSTHVSLMPLWLGTQRQKEFWVEIGEWLDVVDQERQIMDVDRATAKA